MAMTNAERQAAFRARRRAEREAAGEQVRRKPTPAVCGTEAGYDRHIREKTPTCAECRSANAQRQARKRARADA